MAEKTPYAWSRDLAPDWIDHNQDPARVAPMLFRSRMGVVLRPGPLRASRSDCDANETTATRAI